MNERFHYLASMSYHGLLILVCNHFVDGQLDFDIFVVTKNFACQVDHGTMGKSISISTHHIPYQLKQLHVVFSAVTNYKFKC
jgi:hypothetical protein